MKKIIVLIGFILLINATYAQTASIRETPVPSYNPNNSYNPNSVFNVRQSLEAQQQAIRSKYFDKMVPSSNPKPAPTPPPPPPNNNKKKKYSTVIPHTYGMQYVDKETPKQDVIINNNTYNYYNTPTETKKEETKTKELTQAQKDEAERKALRAKYSSILSSTTTPNSVMCKNMAAQFKGVSKDELDRLLNKILRLNCNIEKLGL